MRDSPQRINGHLIAHTDSGFEAEVWRMEQCIGIVNYSRLLGDAMVCLGSGGKAFLRVNLLMGPPPPSFSTQCTTTDPNWRGQNITTNLNSKSVTSKQLAMTLDGLLARDPN